jgi:hypothetical protein
MRTGLLALLVAVDVLAGMGRGKGFGERQTGDQVPHPSEKASRREIRLVVCHA